MAVGFRYNSGPYNSGPYNSGLYRLGTVTLTVRAKATLTLAITVV